MLCPVDQTELRPVERQGIEMDFCPTCRGVWLDRGELDKIIDRTVEGLGRGPVARRSGWEGDAERAARYDDDGGPDRPYDERYDRRYRRHRRSWLGELFDFD
jgi:Zn-finger nucleic acid-binding protein